MSEHISVEFTDAVARIGMNRPDKKNALTVDMYRALHEAIGRAEMDDSIRVILIHGTDDCFTAGHDLKNFLESPPTGEDNPIFDFLCTISQAKKPLVAAVAGPAIGIGTTMLLHCDLVYAGESAQFGLPFVNLGICPEAASSLLLPQMVGYHRAAEIFFLGELFSARQGHEYGLVNAVYPDAELFESALGRARELASRPAAAVALTKALLKQRSAKTVSEVMSEEGRHLLERLASPEAKEAFQAFLERRKPDFSQLQ